VFRLLKKRQKSAIRDTLGVETIRICPVPVFRAKT
jgi:hypothetical protein